MLVCLMGRKKEREAVITSVPKVTGTGTMAGGQVCVHIGHFHAP